MIVMIENKELIQFAFNEIEKRIGHLKCPLCGSTHKDDFFIGERFYHILAMDEEERTMVSEKRASAQLHLSPECIRAVPITCKNCGYMMLLNIDMIKEEK